MTVSKTPRHKVFVSYHHARDQKYADMLRAALADDMVDKSVHERDIDDRIKTATIRQKIRDDFIADASVTIVLVGPETYTRKHVDWEIGSSLRKTKNHPRCGLLGILLPNHPDYGKPRRDSLIPPRLATNLKGQDPYAQMYNWPENNSLVRIRKWIDKAYRRRDGTPPNNGLRPFANNRKPINPRAASPTADGRKRLDTEQRARALARKLLSRKGASPRRRNQNAGVRKSGMGPLPRVIVRRR